MKKLLWIVWLWVLVLPAFAQPDTLQKTVNRKVHWLVGVDAFSALNFFSLVGGVEINRSKYSISLSHMKHSTRIGGYYDFYVSKKYKFLVGIGFHNSFRFDKFEQSRAEYVDSLERNYIQAKTSDVSFMPNYGEVRHLYFISAGLIKEFKLSKGLFLSLKIMLVYGINTYYKAQEFESRYGLQVYYKF